MLVCLCKVVATLGNVVTVQEKMSEQNRIKNAIKIRHLFYFEWKHKNILLYWSTIEIDIILYYIYAAIDEEETELYTTKKEIYIYIFIYKYIQY